MNRIAYLLAQAAFAACLIPFSNTAFSQAPKVISLSEVSTETIGPEANWYLSDGKLVRGKLLNGKDIRIRTADGGQTVISLSEVTPQLDQQLRGSLGDAYPMFHYLLPLRSYALGQAISPTIDGKKYSDIYFLKRLGDRIVFKSGISFPATYLSIAENALTAADQALIKRSVRQDILAVLRGKPNTYFPEMEYVIAIDENFVYAKIQNNPLCAAVTAFDQNQLKAIRDHLKNHPEIKPPTTKEKSQTPMLVHYHSGEQQFMFLNTLDEVKDYPLGDLVPQDLEALKVWVDRVGRSFPNLSTIKSNIANAVKESQTALPLHRFTLADGLISFEARFQKELKKGISVLESSDKTQFCVEHWKLDQPSQLVLDELDAQTKSTLAMTAPELYLSATNDGITFGKLDYKIEPDTNSILQLTRTDNSSQFNYSKLVGQDYLAAKLILEHNTAHPSEAPAKLLSDLPVDDPRQAIDARRLLDYERSIGLIEPGPYSGRPLGDSLSFRLMLSKCFLAIDDDYVFRGADGVAFVSNKSVLKEEDRLRASSQLQAVEDFIRDFKLEQQPLPWYCNSAMPRALRSSNPAASGASIAKLDAPVLDQKSSFAYKYLDGRDGNNSPSEFQVNDLNFASIDLLVEKLMQAQKTREQNQPLQQQIAITKQLRQQAASELKALQSEAAEKMAASAVAKTTPPPTLSNKDQDLKHREEEKVEELNAPAGSGVRMRGEDLQDARDQAQMAVLNIADEFDLWRMQTRWNFRAELIDRNDAGLVFKLPDGQEVLVFETQLDQPSLEKAAERIPTVTRADRTWNRFLTQIGRKGVPIQRIPHEILSASSSELEVKFTHSGTKKISTKQVNPAFLSDLISYFDRQRTGIARDLDFDEQFLKSVPGNEIVRETPDLDQKYTLYLAALSPVAPEELIGQIVSEDSGAKLLAVDFEGNRVVLASSSSIVQDLEQKKTFSLPASINRSLPIMFVGDNSEIVFFGKEALEHWDYAKNQKLKTYPISVDQISLCAPTKKGGALFAITKDSKLQRINTQDRTVTEISYSPVDVQIYGVPIWLTPSSDGHTLAIFQVGNGILLSGPNLEKSEPFKHTFVPKILQQNSSLEDATLIVRVDISPGTQIVDLRNQINDSFEEIGVSVHSTFYLEAETTLPRVILRASDEVKDQSKLYVAESTDTASGWFNGKWSDDSTTSGNGQCIFYRDGDKLQRIEIRTPFLDQDTVLLQAATALAESRDVGQMEAFAQELRKPPYKEMGTYSDDFYIRYINSLYAAIRELDSVQGGDLDNRLALRMNQWFQKYPSYAICRSYILQYLVNSAWAARGRGFANTVSEEGWKQFQEQLGKANEVIAPALASQNFDSHTIQIAVEILKTTDFDKKELSRLVVAAIKEGCGDSPAVHAAAVECLLPRWHGEEGDLEKYCSAVADKLGGKTGDRVYYECVRRVAKYYPRFEPITNHHKLDLERATKGAIAAMEMNVPGSEINELLLILDVAKRPELSDRIVQSSAQAHYLLSKGRQKFRGPMVLQPGKPIDPPATDRK